MGAIFENVNESFSFQFVGVDIAPNLVLEVMQESFTAVDENGIEISTFDFRSYDDRVKLGQEIVKKMYEDED
jgi:hypothetical protein